MFVKSEHPTAMPRFRAVPTHWLTYRSEMVFSPEYEYDKLVLPEGAEQLATGSVRVNW